MNDNTDGTEPKPAVLGREPRQLPRRFYKDVTVAETDGGEGVAPRFRILLDGRPTRTPAKRELALPSRVLAEAVAEEWRAQAAVIDPASMHLTRIVNSAIDGVTGREAEVRAEIVGYAGSDLLCYRAAGPVSLVERQAKLWGPLVHWAATELGVELALAEGVVYVSQKPAALERFGQHLTGFDPLRLAALHVVTTLTGSAVLALACARGRLTSDDAWQLAHVDEDFQIEQWGTDAEAESRRARRRAEHEAAVRPLVLAG